MTVQVPVRLLAAGHGPAFGQIENLSVSGGFVRTDWPGPPGARVQLEILRNGSIAPNMERIAAHVTRTTSDGMAVEWCDLAPQPVRHLLGTNLHPPLRLVRAERFRRVRIAAGAQPPLADAVAVDCRTTRAAG